MTDKERKQGKVGRPRKRMPHDVQLHVIVPRELHAALTEEALRVKLNLSDLVRACLRERAEQKARPRNDEAFERQVLRELRHLRRAVEESAFASQVAAETVAAHFQHSLASGPEPQTDAERRLHLERGERRWAGAVGAIREMLAVPGGEYLGHFVKAQPVRSEDFPHVPDDVLAQIRDNG